MAMRKGLTNAGQSLLRSARSHVIHRGLVTVSLPDLPYDYGELQPVISARIMELHHSKHHAAYVTNFNKASESAAQAEAKGDVASIIALQSAIKFNGGGAWWCSMRGGASMTHTHHQVTSTTTCFGKTSSPPRTTHHPPDRCSRPSSAISARSMRSSPSSTPLLQACRAPGGGGSASTRLPGGWWWRPPPTRTHS